MCDCRVLVVGASWDWFRALIQPRDCFQAFLEAGRAYKVWDVGS